jgi:hypothetical protein
MKQLKDELTRLRTDTGDKSLSMESAVSILEKRIEQIDNRFDKMMTEMASVSVNIFFPHNVSFLY